MPTFNYSAIESSSGKEKQGSIESISSEQASADLKAMGLIPTALAVDGANLKQNSPTKKKSDALSSAETTTTFRAKKRAKGCHLEKLSALPV